MNSRASAARILVEVLGEGRSLSTALPRGLEGVAPSDRALVQNLCYGTLRSYSRLRAVVKPLLKHPFKPRDLDIELLVLIGAHQLLELQTPAHAAINECVAATRQFDKGWAKGVVNGVLRNLQRRSEELLAGVESDPVARFAHPQWLVERVRKAWPDDWQAVLEGNNARAPMSLRVNSSQVARDNYLQQLNEAEISALPDANVASALLLERPVDVSRLTGFDRGLVSVQDCAAQLAVPLLDLKAGQRVLDACAAPGGKTGHILESEPGLAEVVALDSDAGRLVRVTENLERIGLSATLVEADAGDTESWWDGVPFDRILLDAPCSATGVIRRHPDIKWLRRPNDISALVVEQQRLLEALWPLLASDGMLLYATCSILPAENEQQIAAFVERHDDVVEHPIEAEWGRKQRYGRQILPAEGGMDGFYYAALVKR